MLRFLHRLFSTKPDESQHGTCVQLAIYNFENVEGGWCKLSDVAAIAHTNELGVLWRFGPLFRKGCIADMAEPFHNSTTIFCCHWMSIVASNGRTAILGEIPASKPFGRRINLARLYVPAGWAGDVVKALKMGAMYVKKDDDGRVAHFDSHGIEVSSP